MLHPYLAANKNFLSKCGQKTHPKGHAVHTHTPFFSACGRICST